MSFEGHACEVTSSGAFCECSWRVSVILVSYCRTELECRWHGTRFSLRCRGSYIFES
jgi:hypothetical protein